MKYKIILASASKRRSQILKQCGIAHKVVVSGAPEKMERQKGAEFNVRHNARLKAEKVADRYSQGFIIGADTIVSLKGRLIGKPKTKQEAIALLRAFSGKTILVYTGLCVIDAKRKKSASTVDLSKVYVRRIRRKKINEFAKICGPTDKAGLPARGFAARRAGKADPFTDKAGGFSIEGPGAIIFDNIKGSFSNILGLPMMKLDQLFEKLGADLFR